MQQEPFAHMMSLWPMGTNTTSRGRTAAVVKCGSCLTTGLVPPTCTICRLTEGVTGSHQNWRRWETRERAALKETTKHSGKGTSKGPAREQWGPAAPKIQTSNSNPTARRYSTRAQWRVKHHQALGQSTTSQGGSQPAPQGNPQGVPSQNRQ